MSRGMQHGRCLCGAVTISAVLGEEMSACFCEMCVHWSGSAMMVVPARGMAMSGPVRTYRSSSFAERAWCDVCGSNLWIKDDDGQYELMPGLFENAGGARLTRIVFADLRPEGWDYAGEQNRVSRADYIAEKPWVPPEEAP